MLIPGAMAAVTYTAATVNNAFERDGNALFRVFGSHVSTTFFMNLFWRVSLQA